MWVEYFELYKRIVCGTEHNNFCRVWCRFEETESLIESCSDTRSKRGSEDRVKQKVLVMNLSMARSQLRNFTQMSGTTSKRTQVERKCSVDYVNTNMPTSE